MTATPTGISLLSCLRSLGSSTELMETPEEFFVEQEERQAFRWLREYVRDHHRFPGVLIFRTHTNIAPVVTQEPISYYRDRARQRLLYREITSLYNDFKESIVNKEPDRTIAIAKQIAALENRFSSHASEQTFADALDTVTEDFRESKATVGLRGIPTGYDFLDDETNGWQNTDNIALCGRISDGKSMLAIKHAFAAHDAGKCVLFQSNEMGVLQIVRRMVGLRARINPRSIARGEISTHNQRRFYETITTMAEGVPMHVVAGSFTSSTGALRALCEKHCPDIIICDASYLLTPEKRSASRRENLVDVANDLKRISIDFNRPLLHTVQFNRTAIRGGKKKEGEEEAETPPAAPPPRQPQRATVADPRYDEPEATPRHRRQRRDYENVSHLGLHKIAETDAIAANASIVAAIARPKGDHYEDRRYYTILKGREGERGLWMINYRFADMNFDELSDDQLNEEQRALTSHML